MHERAGLAIVTVTVAWAMALSPALSPARAAIADAPAVACLRAAAAAEQQYALPRNLLAAIGTVESGRRDPATGRVVPWPFAANIGGADSVFDSAEQAAELVGWAQAHGAAQVDVGCFQVNLKAHPTAFAQTSDGFRARANAAYAAQFLRRLFARTGSWEAAIARYHSGEPGRGAAYLARVLAAWHADVAPPEMPVYSASTLPVRLRAALGLTRGE